MSFQSERELAGADFHRRKDRAFQGTQQYLRACYPSGRYGTKGLVVRWFTGGREPRGTDNEPSGNRSLEPHAWLTDVLTRLPEWPEERLAELLPLEGFTFFG